MARSIAVASGTGDVQAVTGSCTLLGVCVRENAGAPAAAGVVLRDGTSAAGAVVVPVKLAAGATWFGPLPAIEFTTGIFVDRESGTSEVVLYVAG